MRSYPINEARANLSKLVDRAIAGEPQRVTRRNRAAVMIVSEEDWTAGAHRGLNREMWKPREHYDSLGELLADFAEKVGFRDEDFVRVGQTTRPLGADVSE